MKTWLITLRGPGGQEGHFETGETEFFIGAQQAEDVFLISGEGVNDRHAWVRVSSDGLEWEDLAGGVLVNGHPISGRVEVMSPAWVQIGGFRLEWEVQEDGNPDSSVQMLDQQKTLPQKTLARAGGLKMRRNTAGESIDAASIQTEYRLVRELARGGMGRIYFGEDPQLKRQVAVKISSVSAEGPDARFLKEAEVLAQLAHPNIVPIYAMGTDPQGRPCYGMKLVQGRTLQAVVDALREGDPATRREYPRAALLTVFRKVCDALACAHGKGILHRDLKPENIMVGEYGEVLVMDWGLAKVLGEREVLVRGGNGVAEVCDSGKTLEGEVMGTPQYMSPEQAAGKVSDLDARSDIYSLGGILYSILTMRPPVEGTTVEEVLTKVKNGRITPMTTQRRAAARVNAKAPLRMEKSVPESLRAVTLKAMALDRERRYATVEALAADVDAYQNGFATAAEGADAMRRLILFVGRHRAVSGLIALFFLAAALFTVQLNEERKQARVSEQEAIASRALSREEAANAQIALAEVAEESGDSEQMRMALAKVPPDLRDETWEHLQSRSDSADLKVSPPGPSPWLAVEDSPDSADSLIAVQTDGQISRVSTVDGTVVPLWRAERKGSSLNQMAVEPRGESVALVWRKDNICEVEVRSIHSPQLQNENASIALPISDPRSVPWVRYVGGRVFAWSGSPPAGQIGAWDAKTGLLLWRRNAGSVFEFSKDGESLVTQNQAGQFESVRCSDGEMISSSGARFPLPDPVSRWKTDIDPAGSGMVCERGQSTVCLDGKTGFMRWEARNEFGKTVSIQVDPARQIVALLSRRSILGLVFALRSAQTGELLRSFPLNGRLAAGATVGRIVANKEAFAVAFPKRILVWRTGFSPAKVRHAVPGAPNVLRFLPGGELLVHSCLVAGTAELRVLDANQANGKKNLVESIPLEGFGRTGFLAPNRAASRLAVVAEGFVGAYAVEDNRIVEVRRPQKIAGLVGAAHFSMHPTEDKLWLANKVIEVSSGRELATLQVGSAEFFSLRGSARSGEWVGGARLVTPVIARVETPMGVEDQRMLALWSVEGGTMEVKVHAPQVSALSVSGDGKWIAEGGRDKWLRIRDANTLEIDKDFRAHDAELTGVAWHPHLPFLITSAEDGTVRVWDTDTWHVVEELRGEAGETVLELSPDGRRLGVIRSGRMDIFDPESFQE